MGSYSLKTVLERDRKDRPTPTPLARRGSTATPAPAAAILSLQRTIGNRAVGELLARGSRGGSSISPQIQRAILAIDGPDDGDVSKAVTANCLSTLQTTKSIKSDTGTKKPKTYVAGDARGKTYGQDLVDQVGVAARRGVQQGKVAGSEAVYVLGHGGSNKVAGLGPAAMATFLNNVMADRANSDRYTGKIKLVACYSASLNEDGAPIQDNGKPITVPYAGQLAGQLAEQKGQCRASAVEGIAGIAWVDELTGKKTGFDVEGDGSFSPLETIYQDKVLGPEWMDALQEKDPETRREWMQDLLDEMHQRPDFKGVPTRVTGKEARKTYNPAYPKVVSPNRGNLTRGKKWYGKENKPG